MAQQEPMQVSSDDLIQMIGVGAIRISQLEARLNQAMTELTTVTEQLAEMQRQKHTWQERCKELESARNNDEKSACAGQ